jgi:LysR family hydrogen peroxide-inducible transcriptional activator
MKRLGIFEGNKGDNMTLTELRYLIAVAQEKHFGKAAEVCHISQPTLSVAINKLESKLGVKIFEGQPNNIRTTEIGEKIIAQTQRALEEISCIHDIADSGKSELDSPLKIGGIYTVVPYLFPLLVPKIHNRAPHMPLIIQEDFTANLRAKLQQGELDAIFVALPFTENGVVTKTLYDEPFVALMKKDHPLAKDQAINSSDLTSENILLLGEGHCLRDQIETCPHCSNPKLPQRMTEGASLETLRHMVASGFGITILPASATQVNHYNSTLCTRPFKSKTPKRTIALAWRVTFPRPKAIEAVIQSLVEINLRGIHLKDL